MIAAPVRVGQAVDTVAQVGRRFFFHRGCCLSLGRGWAAAGLGAAWRAGWCLAAPSPPPCAVQFHSGSHRALPGCPTTPLAAGGPPQDDHRIPDAHHARAAERGGARGAGHREVHPGWAAWGGCYWFHVAFYFTPHRTRVARVWGRSLGGRGLEDCMSALPDRHRPPALRTSCSRRACPASRPAASGTLEGVVILRENPDYVETHE